MKSIRILIVEDEPIIAKDLSHILGDLGYEVAGIKYEAQDAIDFMEQHEVDLLLLDINIEGDKDGIELAAIINQRFHVPFIYLTSHSDPKTIERAKSTAPLAYLVKPIDEKDLTTTIEIAFHNYNNSIQETKEKKTLDDTVFIKSGSAFQKLKVHEILYAEANDNYTFIYTAGQKYLLSSTLKLVEQKLSQWNFMRIHRSFVINLSQISKLEDNAVFIDEKSLPVSRTYRKDLYDKLSIF